MSPTNADFHDLAHRVLEHTAGGPLDLNDLEGATERIFVKLREHLTRRFGAAGGQELVSRAVRLAGNKRPSDVGIQIGFDGHVVGLGDILQRQGLAEATNAVIEVLASLFVLLETFIGGSLTLRLVQSAWPDVTDSGPDTCPGEAPT